jgi:PilZ domain
MLKWLVSLWRNLPEEAPAGGAATAASVVPFGRRQAVRHASEMTLLCHPATAAEGTHLPVRVRDVSVGGIGLLSQHFFEPGTLLELERPDLRMLSCVRHIRRQGAHAWILGCSFIRDLSEREVQVFL